MAQRRRQRRAGLAAARRQPQACPGTGGRVARASRPQRARRPLSTRAVGRPEETRRAGTGAGAEAAPAADGRALRLARRDHARTGDTRSADIGRSRAHDRAPGDARPRGGAGALGRDLPAVARAARTYLAALRRADPAAARHSGGAHPSGFRAAAGGRLARPVARSRGRRRGMKSALDRVWLRQVASLVVFVALWEGASRGGFLNPLYIPAPSAVASALIELFGSGTIWPHLVATFRAAIAGLVLGLVVGTVLGILAALLPFLAELIEPFMILLNAVPRVVLAPLFVIWFGIDLGSKIALAFILVAVLIFFTVFTGIRQVDRRLVELKVAVGFAFTGAVVGEFVDASRGLGYLLSFAQSTYNAALMLALVLLIMLFVLLIFALSERLEKRLTRWRG